MAKKKATKKLPDPSPRKREIREISDAELEQVSGGTGATGVLADAKRVADARHVADAATRVLADAKSPFSG